jgi:hypothetical protein
MSLQTRWRSLIFLFAFWSFPAYAEYCVDWSSFVQRGSGTSGHCWASEPECSSYVMSRPMGDFSGGCYYKPGLYPPTGSKQGGNTSSASKDAANKAAAAQKSKEDAAKRQQVEAEQKAFNEEQKSLLDSVKGVTSRSEPANNISLKPVPPAGGLSRSQLDCIARSKPGESWEKRAADCTPVIPNVPEPPSPTPVDVPTDPALLAKFLASLGQRISTSRESLVRQDKEISTQEHTIAQEELKIADPAKPKGESDALRRAREALAKAKADRARTATELARLEQQEQAARHKAGPEAQ